MTVKKEVIKRCKICKNIYIPRNSLQQVCDYKCAIEHNKIKEKKKAEAEWKVQKSVLKDNTMTLPQLKEEAKKEFQHFIRLRDKDLPCISCGVIKADWAGGHYFSAGKYSGLVFNESNCHKQCNTHCNKYLSGNLLEYRKGLIKRYGDQFVEDLESQSDQKRDYKYTKNELIAKKLQYQIKIKELK